jgi:hypothetical protein
MRTDRSTPSPSCWQRARAIPTQPAPRPPASVDLAQVGFNAASKRIVYSGPLLQLAKAVSDAGRGGDITLSPAVLAALGERVSSLESCVVLFAGKHIVKEDSAATDVYTCYPRSLFPRAAYLEGLRAHETQVGRADPNRLSRPCLLASISQERRQGT